MVFETDLVIWSSPAYLVPERKLGFFVQIKEGDPADGGINRRNTLSISRIKI